MEPSKSPTIHDVAKRAGVSLSTVSRVMNDYAFVNPQTREKVEAAIQHLGYEKSRPESVRPAREMNTIGLIVPDIANPFFPLLIRGVETVAKIQGYSLVFCDSENELGQEQQHLETLFERGVDGVILIPSAATTHVEMFVNNEIPLVFLDRVLGLEEANYVICDNDEGAYQAVTYLLKLGHERLLFVTGPPYLTTEQARLAGCRRALAEAGVKSADADWVMGNYRIEDAQQVVAAALEQRLEFTAVFATNDMMALGVKQALEKHGLTIPQDVSLVGYDDILFAGMLGLTTISQPAYEMGRNAMFLLLDLIHERMTAPQHIILRPSMVIRSSCQRR